MFHQRRPWIVSVASIVLAIAGGAAGAAEYSLGIGAGFAPDYEGSDDYETVPTWLLSASNLYHPDAYVTLAGPVLRSNFVPHPQFRAGLAAQWVDDRDDVDDDAVEELGGTDTALLLGATVGWDFLANQPVSLTAAADIRYDVAHGNGYLVTPRLTYANVWPESRFSVAAELFGNWASDDYMSEQFGIDADEAARAGLDAHDADAGFKDAGIRLSVDYRFVDNVSGTLLGSYSRILGDAADSPIVDDRGDENQFFVGTLVSYHF